jgi:hypothetical protein
VITRLTVSRGPAGRGSPLRVRYLIRDRSPRVRVTLSFVRPGQGTVFRAGRGWQRTGSFHSYSMSSASERTLVPDGSYEIRVSARDPGGNQLVRRVESQGFHSTFAGHNHGVMFFARPASMTTRAGRELESRSHFLPSPATT